MRQVQTTWEQLRIQLQVTAALTRDLNPLHNNSWLVLILRPHLSFLITDRVNGVLTINNRLDRKEFSESELLWPAPCNCHLRLIELINTATWNKLEASALPTDWRATRNYSLILLPIHITKHPQFAVGRCPSLSLTSPGHPSKASVSAFRR